MTIYEIITQLYFDPKYKHLFNLPANVENPVYQIVDAFKCCRSRHYLRAKIHFIVEEGL